MFDYWLYGLRVRSAIPLPELVAAPASAESDVTVHLGDVELGDYDPSAGRADLKLSRDGTTFHLENVATYQVRDGRQIVINPVAGSDAGALRVNLLGVAFGMLLHQRGLMAIHASAVAVGGSAVLFLGFSGDGKSTTAAAMVRRGHALITDDIAAVQFDGDEARVWPAFPEIRLLCDSVASLGPTCNATRPDPGDKYSFRTEKRFSTASLPLGRVYLLTPADRNEIEPLRPVAACAEYLRHSFVAGILKPTGTTSWYFHRCAELARQIPVFRLKRRRSLELIDELAELIENDLHVCA